MAGAGFNTAFLQLAGTENYCTGHRIAFGPRRPMTCQQGRKLGDIGNG
jgi:hypothetical protein